MSSDYREGYCLTHEAWAYIDAMGPDCRWEQERDG